MSVIGALALSLSVLPLAVVAQEVETTVSSADIVAVWNEDRSHVFDPDQVDLEELVWSARAIVVFANTPDDPLYLQQLSMLIEGTDLLTDRDVIIIADGNIDPPSGLREQLRPRGFALVLIDKDGRVALRKPLPWSVRELTRVIDKTSLRQQEVIDRRAANLE